MLYLTLNKGYQKRLKDKKMFGVNRNVEGVPVDFDTSKYVKPFKKKMPKVVMEEELMSV